VISLMCLCVTCSGTCRQDYLRRSRVCFQADLLLNYIRHLITALKHYPPRTNGTPDHQHQARSDKMPPQPHSPQDRAHKGAMTKQRAIEDSITKVNLTTAHRTTVNHSQSTKTSATGWLQHRCHQPNFPLPRELRDQ
jgi:hypothetical protein